MRSAGEPHQPRTGYTPLHELISRFASRLPVREEAKTSVRFPFTPEAVWRRLMLYEEVPGRLPLLLRLFLPRPVRTDGAKEKAGAEIRCIYESGYLVKRILDVTPPFSFFFDVAEQKLGIEDQVLALRGSYQLQPLTRGTETVLTTIYLAYLRPRWLFRPIERFFARRFHLHILAGVRAALRAKETCNASAAVERRMPKVVS